MDATGHFTKTFRNVLFRVGEDSAVTPEFDRVALEVVEDAWLHLSFQYKAYGDNTVRAVLTDTVMLGQEVQPHASFNVGNIAG